MLFDLRQNNSNCHNHNKIRIFLYMADWTAVEILIGAVEILHAIIILSL